MADETKELSFEERANLLSNDTFVTKKEVPDKVDTETVETETEPQKEPEQTQDEPVQKVEGADKEEKSVKHFQSKYNQERNERLRIQAELEKLKADKGVEPQTVADTPSAEPPKVEKPKEPELPVLDRPIPPKVQKPVKPKDYDPIDALNDPSSLSYQYAQAKEEYDDAWREYEFSKSNYDLEIEKRNADIFRKQQEAEASQHAYAKYKADLINGFIQKGAEPDEAEEMFNYYFNSPESRDPEFLITSFRVRKGTHKQEAKPAKPKAKHTQPLPPGVGAENEEIGLDANQQFGEQLKNGRVPDYGL